MGDILRLCQGQFLIHIDKDDFGSDSVQRHSIGGRTADHAGSDDSEFHSDSSELAGVRAGYAWIRER